MEPMMGEMEWKPVLKHAVHFQLLSGGRRIELLRIQESIIEVDGIEYGHRRRAKS